jgi:hypothetical protein
MRQGCGSRRWPAAVVGHVTGLCQAAGVVGWLLQSALCCMPAAVNQLKSAVVGWLCRVCAHLAQDLQKLQCSSAIMICAVQCRCAS